MNTNKIRQALMNGSLEARIDALAELDKAQQPGKALTDEEIERIARYEFRRVSDQDGLHDDNADKRDAFADGLRYARDNYGIGTPAAGLTVEEALKAITPFTSNEIMEHYRARLTAALEAKTRTA